LLREQPLVGGGALHQNGGPLREEPLVRVLPALDGEEPVQRVVLVGDPAVDAGRGVEDDFSHVGTLRPRTDSSGRLPPMHTGPGPWETLHHAALLPPRTRRRTDRVAGAAAATVGVLGPRSAAHGGHG